jgi:hypothetical protein
MKPTGHHAAHHATRRTAQLLAAIALMVGCGSEPTATRARPDGQPLASKEHDGSSANVQRDLAALRRVTAPFHRFDRAVTAGWSAKITACMESAEGGMGFHYGNTALIDGSVRADEPELLLYEPARHGRLRLVAVEYIIPYTAHARSAAPPVLFGQRFTQNDTFQLWGLHVWVWKDNPRGLYASWNPRVSCEHTTDVMAMAHP